MKAFAFALFMIGAATAPAYAFTHYLVAQWYQGGDQMCRYDNGTVLNVGIRLCPLSIQG